MQPQPFPTASQNGQERWREFPLPPGIRTVPGEEHRFFVQSKTRFDTWHLVDLEELGWNGRCSCEHFNFRLFPQIRDDRAKRRPPRTRRCWHIREALAFYGELAARLVARHNERTYAARALGPSRTTDSQDYVLHR